MDLKNKTFIIAELSANHNHNLETAIKTVEAANRAGADAIKLQTYTPDTMTIDCDNEYFRINQGTVWDGKTLYELYKEAYTPWEWHPILKKVAEDLGMVFFSTPFDKTAVDFLEKLDVPMYKIASFEITDTPLIEYTASKGKPLLISTGVAGLTDIDDALNACKKIKKEDITLLKCTSAYPAPVKDANLITIPDMKRMFGVKVGLSDHTTESDVSVAAVALGASVIEKHLILDRNIGGPDSSFSIEPKQFSDMVISIRNVELALGNVNYYIKDDHKCISNFSRSLFVVKDVCKGEIFTENNIKSIRPGYGLKPKNIINILGKRSAKGIKRGTPLTWDLVSS